MLTSKRKSRLGRQFQSPPSTTAKVASDEQQGKVLMLLLLVVLLDIMCLSHEMPLDLLLIEVDNRRGKGAIFHYEASWSGLSKNIYESCSIMGG